MRKFLALVVGVASASLVCGCGGGGGSGTHTATVTASAQATTISNSSPFWMTYLAVSRDFTQYQLGRPLDELGTSLTQSEYTACQTLEDDAITGLEGPQAPDRELAIAINAVEIQAKDIGKECVGGLVASQSTDQAFIDAEERVSPIARADGLTVDG